MSPLRAGLRRETSSLLPITCKPPRLVVRYNVRMSETQTSANYTYIDLDDPPSWWARLLLGILVLLMAAVIIAPWFMDLGETDTAPAQANSIQSGGTLCRPNTDGLPNLLNPSIGSWTRLCEWFIEPELDNP